MVDSSAWFLVQFAMFAGLELVDVMRGHQATKSPDSSNEEGFAITSVDRTEVRQICKRLFANRKKQSWPPKIEISDEWRVAYAGMVGDIPVLPTVDEAVAWTNELIAKIDAS